MSRPRSKPLCATSGSMRSTSTSTTGRGRMSTRPAAPATNAIPTLCLISTRRSSRPGPRFANSRRPEKSSTSAPRTTPAPRWNSSCAMSARTSARSATRWNSTRFSSKRNSAATSNPRASFAPATWRWVRRSARAATNSRSTAPTCTIRSSRKSPASAASRPAPSASPGPPSVRTTAAAMS